MRMGKSGKKRGRDREKEKREERSGIKTKNCLILLTESGEENTPDEKGGKHESNGNSKKD